MRNALVNLMRVVGQYLAPGIPEVDEAMQRAAAAVKARDAFVEKLTKSLGSSFPPNEGLNGRMPTVL